MKRQRTDNHSVPSVKRARLSNDTPKPNRKAGLKSKTLVHGKGKEKETSSISKPVLPASSKVSKATRAKPVPTAAPPPPPLPTAFKVIAGSYEKLLYGLQGTVTVSEEGELQYELKPIFIFPAHVSSVKAVAASPAGGKWLATGSVDEIIKVWDLRRRKEVGGLMHHTGTSLPFYLLFLD
jgi:protein MAK11